MVLSLSLALHVVDEAVGGFLDVWNPLVESIRARAPIVPLPTFTFGIWLGGLIAAVIALLSLSRLVARANRWMVPLSYVFAVLMCGNGLLHIVGSLYLGRVVPGLYSAPILIVASVSHFWTSRRFRLDPENHSPNPRPT